MALEDSDTKEQKKESQAKSSNFQLKNFNTFIIKKTRKDKNCYQFQENLFKKC